jgi:hypothetical protein
MQLTGCDQAEAEAALLLHPNDMIAAIESVLPKNPVISGAKYIPPKPIVDTGMDEEQKERCARGRWMQEKVNAVFSVAHSKTLEQPPEEPESTTSASVVDLPTVEELPESSPGSRG